MKEKIMNISLCIDEIDFATPCLCINSMRDIFTKGEYYKCLLYSANDEYRLKYPDRADSWSVFTKDKGKAHFSVEDFNFHFKNMMDVREEKLNILLNE